MKNIKNLNERLYCFVRNHSPEESRRALKLFSKLSRIDSKELQVYSQKNKGISSGLAQSVLYSRGEPIKKFVGIYAGAFIEVEGSILSYQNVHVFRGKNSGRGILFKGIFSGNGSSFSGENSGIDVVFEGMNSGINVVFEGKNAGEGSSFNGPFSDEFVFFDEEDRKEIMKKNLEEDNLRQDSFYGNFSSSYISSFYGSSSSYSDGKYGSWANNRKATFGERVGKWFGENIGFPFFESNGPYHDQS
jgi:hypothetical protein